MSTTKPRKRTVTREDLARTIQAEPTPPPDPTVCRCRPVTVGTFAGEQLVAVERRHMRRQGCHRPPEPVDVRDYVADIRGGRR